MWDNYLRDYLQHTSEDEAASTHHDARLHVVRRLPVRYEHVATCVRCRNSYRRRISHAGRSPLQSRIPIRLAQNSQAILDSFRFLYRIISKRKVSTLLNCFLNGFLSNKEPKRPTRMDLSKVMKPAGLGTFTARKGASVWPKTRRDPIHTIRTPRNMHHTCEHVPPAHMGEWIRLEKSPPA